MSPKMAFISLFYLFLLFLSQSNANNDYDFHNEWDEQGHPKDNQHHQDHQDYDGGRGYGSEHGRGHERGKYQHHDDLHFYSGGDSMPDTGDNYPDTGDTGHPLSRSLEGSPQRGHKFGFGGGSPPRIARRNVHDTGHPLSRSREVSPQRGHKFGFRGGSPPGIARRSVHDTGDNYPDTGHPLSRSRGGSPQMGHKFGFGGGLQKGRWGKTKDNYMKRLKEWQKTHPPPPGEGDRQDGHRGSGPLPMHERPPPPLGAQRRRPPPPSDPEEPPSDEPGSHLEEQEINEDPEHDRGHERGKYQHHDDLHFYSGGDSGGDSMPDTGDNYPDTGDTGHSVQSFSSDFNGGLIDQDRTQAGLRKGGLNVGGHDHYGRPIEDQQIQPDRQPNEGEFPAQSNLKPRGRQSLFDKARERYRQRRNQIEEEMAQRLERFRNKGSKSDVGVSGGKQIENHPDLPQDHNHPQDNKFEEETSGHEPPPEIVPPSNAEPPQAVQISPGGPPAPAGIKSFSDLEYDEGDQDRERGDRRSHRGRYDEDDYEPRNEKRRHRGRGRGSQRIGLYSGLTQGKKRVRREVSGSKSKSKSNKKPKIEDNEESADPPPPPDTEAPEESLTQEQIDAIHGISPKDKQDGFQSPKRRSLIDDQDANEKSTKKKVPQNYFSISFSGDKSKNK